MIERSIYLNKLIPLIDKALIKVLTGVRRSGKTVLLKQIQRCILTKGVAESQILYISFESKRNVKYKDADVLYNYIIESSEKLNNKIYIFLDEIQVVDKWEEVVSSLLVDIDCDIYITGSNSNLLSGELATLIAGRYIQINVFPFTLKETKEISIKNGKFTSDEALFIDYLKYGGLPMRFALEDISVETYISDTYDAIVLKDIIARNKITDHALLTNILHFIMDNIANPFSARTIASSLATVGVKTSTTTVLNYIDYIKKAMIINSAKRYDIKGKKILTSNEKYYAVDLGLRNSVKTSLTVDYNKLYENIIFLELMSRGYTVTVGKLDDLEIDFIAYKGDEKLYIQVCYLLASDDTINREFGNLQKVTDNYPKYVISSDRLDFSRNGIKHLNILDFLLNN